MSVDAGKSRASRAQGTVRGAARQLEVEVACFALVTGVYLLHLFVSGYDRFYYDAQFYWNLGQSFEHNGHFSLVSYGGAAFHGYSIPLLAYVLQSMASVLDIGSVTIVKLFGALTAATLGVVVAPRLAKALFPGASIGWRRVLVLNALFFIFWRDYFGFLLSDFPALLAASVAIMGLLRATTAGYVVAGLGLGLAANMRPAYLPALIVGLGVAALLPLRDFDLRARGVAAGLVVAGAFIAFLPQVLINHHQRASWSPFVPEGRVIAMQQLSDGMRAQKYETFVGPATRYPQPEVFFFDPSTTHVLEAEHLPTNTIVLGQFDAISSYRQYLGIVLRHPAELAASFVRHVFNGLDVRYPTPYVRDLRDKSILLSLLLYTVMFIALARLLVADARRALGRIRWSGVVVLLSACLTAAPSEAESRFFLPLQLFVYMLVCFGPATRSSLLAVSTSRRVGLALSYAAFVLVCLTLSSDTFSQIQHPELVLGLGSAISTSLSFVAG
jgi:hypothetical protein